MPRFVRHAAIAAAGLAAGHLLHSMRERNAHVSILTCDNVTKVRIVSMLLVLLRIIFLTCPCNGQMAVLTCDAVIKV